MGVLTIVTATAVATDLVETAHQFAYVPCMRQRRERYILQAGSLGELARALCLVGCAVWVMEYDFVGGMYTIMVAL